MRTTYVGDLYLAAEAVVNAHLRDCGRCSRKDICPDGFAAVGAESRAWEAFEAADPKGAAEYDRARTPR